MPRRHLYPRAASAVLFPTVPHLLGSAAGPGDVVFSAEQTRAFLSGPVRVVEKLDGLNVGLFFTPRGGLRFVSRAHGVLRPAQLGRGLWPLIDWAFERLPALLALVGAHRVLYGEWLNAPRRLPYPRRDTDFVAFALFQRGRGFLPGRETERRVGDAGLTPRPVRFDGRVASVADLARWTRTSAFGGPAEGVVLEARDGRWAKFVRADWERRPLRDTPTPRAEWPGPPRVHGRFVKRFPAAREADAELEARVLRAVQPLRLAPTLRESRALPRGGRALILDAVAGRPWPPRATPALAAALGRQLGRLHGTRVPGPLPVLAGDATAHLARTAHAPRLRALLEANAAGLARPALVTCHGDLKAENLRVRGDAVWLLDFERACRADPAWELACAMDRLALDARGRQALLLGWLGERDDAQLAVRVQLFRLAWDVALPHAVAALEQDTGRRPSATALKLAGAATRRARRLEAALQRFAAPKSPPRSPVRRAPPAVR